MNSIQTANVGACSIEYSLSGPEGKPVLVFAHGLSANMRQFEDQVGNFNTHYRVLLFSLRGHGKSTYPESASRSDFTLEVMVDDVIALFDKLEISAVHWVGNSMGGLVGYELLRHASNRLLSLTTFGTTAELRFGPAAVALITWTKDVLIKLKGYEWFCRFVGRASSKNKEVQEKVTELILTADPLAVRYGQMNIGNYNYLETMSISKIPFLLIRCEHDNDINKNIATTLEAINKRDNASLVELTAAGHFANLDQPEDFNNTLANWLSQVQEA